MNKQTIFPTQNFFGGNRRGPTGRILVGVGIVATSVALLPLVVLALAGAGMSMPPISRDGLFPAKGEPSASGSEQA